MKRLLGSTAALSIALAPIQPWPLMAQTLTETGAVVAADGSVLCEPTADALCDPAAFVEQAAIVAAQMAEAEAAAAAQAAVDAEAAAAAAAQVSVSAEAAAAAAAPAEVEAAAAAVEATAAAQASVEAEAASAAAAAAAVEAEAAAAAAAVEAEAAAAAQAAVEAEAAAAAQAAVEAEAAAAAQAAVEAEAAAAAQAAVEAEAAAAAQAAVEAEAAAAAQAAGEAEAAAAAQAAGEAEAAAAAQAAGEAEAAAAAQAAVEAEAAAAAQAAVEAEAAAAAKVDAVTEPAAPEVAVDPAAVVEDVKTEETIAAEAKALETAQEEIVVSSDGVIIDPAAGLATAEVVIDPTAEPVAAPDVTEAETETLSDLLSAPSDAAPVELGAAAALVEAAPTDGALVPLADAPASADAVTTAVEVLTETDTRSSAQEFTAAPVVVAPGKKNRLSDLEKVGLLALSALVVGAVIKDVKKNKAAGVAAGEVTGDRQVVSNTGDRVVVLNPDGTYSVYKDDDTVLRRPGSTVRTETFKDGSTRTIVEREDGTQVVTIRDATGRVLRRSSYDERGRELVLIDDFVEETPVIISRLPKPKPNRVTISAKDEGAALKAKLAAREAAKSGRTFSLRQVREIPEVRALAATIDAGNVTFDSGSAAIKATEADALADLGSLMQALLDENPSEVFLIEGHTDATGKAALNLALSDRRAESVALALAEYFDIPPENMVVQGYGEGELLIETQANERRNRRVAARVITPLLRLAE